MSIKDIQKLAIDLLAKLPFDPLKDVLKTLLNTVEEKTTENDQLQGENQKLRGQPTQRRKGEAADQTICRSARGRIEKAPQAAPQRGEIRKARQS